MITKHGLFSMFKEIHTRCYTIIHSLQLSCVEYSGCSWITDPWCFRGKSVAAPQSTLILTVVLVLNLNRWNAVAGWFWPRLMHLDVTDLWTEITSTLEYNMKQTECHRKGLFRKVFKIQYSSLLCKTKLTFIEYCNLQNFDIKTTQLKPNLQRQTFSSASKRGSC